MVRAFRRCQEAEELSREARQQQSRRVSYRYDDDGSLILDCRLPAEAGAKIVKALEIALEQLPQDPPTDVPAGTSPDQVPFSARRADALALVAESFLAHGALEASGTDRHQIVVHVAKETLRDRAAGCCEFEHGPSMAAETARRLACDASVVELIEDEDGRAAECRPQDADDLGAAAPRAQRPRQGLPISRLLQHPLHRCASRRALGQRRRDEAIQSRVAMPLPSPRRS